MLRGRLSCFCFFVFFGAGVDGDVAVVVEPVGDLVLGGDGSVSRVAVVRDHGVRGRARVGGAAVAVTARAAAVDVASVAAVHVVGRIASAAAGGGRPEEDGEGEHGLRVDCGNADRARNARSRAGGT